MPTSTQLYVSPDKIRSHLAKATDAEITEELMINVLNESLAGTDDPGTSIPVYAGSFIKNSKSIYYAKGDDRNSYSSALIGLSSVYMKNSKASHDGILLAVERAMNCTTKIYDRETYLGAVDITSDKTTDSVKLASVAYNQHYMCLIYEYIVDDEHVVTSANKKRVISVTALDNLPKDLPKYQRKCINVSKPIVCVLE